MSGQKNRVTVQNSWVKFRCFAFSEINWYWWVFGFIPDRWQKICTIGKLYRNILVKPRYRGKLDKVFNAGVGEGCHFTFFLINLITPINYVWLTFYFYIIPTIHYPYTVVKYLVVKYLNLFFPNLAKTLFLAFAKFSQIF